MKNENMFYIKNLTQDLSNEGEIDPDEVERMEDAWGDKMRSKDDFQIARNGDHIFIPFECHFYIFLKLKNREPNRDNEKDQLLLKCAQRVILDSFWSRGSSTIDGYVRLARTQLKLSDQLGLDGPFTLKSPMPVHDHCGYELAISMVLYSTRPGRHDRNYTQFDTIRKLRTVCGNFIRAYGNSNHLNLAMSDQKGGYQVISQDESASFWFKQFIIGTKNRMGQVWKPNRGMLTKLLLELIKVIEEKIENQIVAIDTHKWIVFSTYVTLTYVLSLRGAEGFLIDLKGIRSHWSEERNKYTVIALMGRVKGEQHRRNHLLPCANLTDSGIPVRDIVKRLIDYKESFGILDGPAISSSTKLIYTARDLDDMLLESLSEIYSKTPKMFPLDIKTAEDIESNYQCFRTFRRSFNTRAIEVKIDLKDQQIVNRWRTVERAGGKRPSMPMHMHNAQFDELLKPFLRYTRST